MTDYMIVRVSDQAAVHTVHHVDDVQESEAAWVFFRDGVEVERCPRGPGLVLQEKYPRITIRDEDEW